MRYSRALTGKTILVTGGSGFVGAHLVRALQKVPEARVLVLIRGSCAIAPQKKVEYLRGSLSDLTNLYWKDHGIDRIDVVFHLGAFTPKSASCGNNRRAVMNDNIFGTVALIESFREVPEKIVFASTIDVYRLPLAGETIVESSPIDPVTLYAASKFFCERLFQAYAAEKQCGLAILRYGHIFGPGEEAYEKMIPATIKKTLSNESPILHGDGSILRDYLYVGDAVEATLRAAVSGEEFLGPINIVRGSSVSMKDLVEKIAVLARFRGEIRFNPVQSSGYSLCFDNTSMKKKLGTWPIMSLEEGLLKEIQHARVTA